MTTIVTTTQRALGALAFMGAFAGLLLLAAPAQAQIGGEVCADIEGVSDDVLDFYEDELGDEWGIDLNDADLCTDLADNFVKACQKAVGDAVKCVQNQLKALSKQNQIACKALAGDEAKACSTSFKNASKALSELAKTDGEFESNRCADTLALAYFNTCLTGD